MTEAFVRSIQTEYQDLIRVGATEAEAIHQVSISLEVHRDLVIAMLSYIF